MDDEAAVPHCACGSPDEVAEQIAAFRDRGVQHFVVALIAGHNFGEDMHLFAEQVIPQLR
jgi:alkanesulfonate monooxygenase SsuD/methylene tetrahydromethanopterin reductase-like flavin-dependent oxidoreductase (luciferase family)